MFFHTRIVGTGEWWGGFKPAPTKIGDFLLLLMVGIALAEAADGIKAGKERFDHLRIKIFS
jgi:hypothetical protein